MNNKQKIFRRNKKFAVILALALLVLGGLAVTSDYHRPAIINAFAQKVLVLSESIRTTSNTSITGQITEAKMKPSLNGATSWLNGEALNLADLKGKVVVIDFWTYTCINWRRTSPYVREWASKYKDQGLVVIGVHTPEFAFEHKLENVRSAIQAMNINYPVAMDSNFEIWNSFENQYWPALYIFDANGKQRYQKFGEGDYLESELTIQQLLREASPKNSFNSAAKVEPKGAEAAADWENLGSPENFLGYDRAQGFASREGLVINNPVLFRLPTQLSLNNWALSGEWVIGKESVSTSKPNSKVVYRFHARDLHLIMGPTEPGSAIRFRVLIDGKPPGPSHGLDVDNNGNGTLNEHRMYQLIRQEGPIIDREFQIEFLDAEVEVYDFTFG